MKYLHPSLRILHVATIGIFIALIAYFIPSRYIGHICFNCMVMDTRDMWYLSILPTGLLVIPFSVMAVWKEHSRVAIAPMVPVALIVLLMLASCIFYGRPVEHNSALDVLAAWTGYAWWIVIFSCGIVGRPFGAGRFVEPSTNRAWIIPLALPHLLGVGYVLNDVWVRMQYDMCFLLTPASSGIVE